MAETAKDNELAVTLTRGQLKALMREAAAEALSQAAKPPPKWVDVDALAKHFGVSGQTIRNWVATGAPASQVGRNIKAKLDEFETWVETHRPDRKLKRVK